jgi:hypothetical protein
MKKLLIAKVAESRRTPRPLGSASAHAKPANGPGAIAKRAAQLRAATAVIDHVLHGHDMKKLAGLQRSTGLGQLLLARAKSLKATK